MHSLASQTHRFVLALLAGLSLASTAVAAQSNLGEGRRQAKRDELEQAARATEQAATVAPDAKTRDKLTRDAAAIRQRLRNGDFLPGDRIYLAVLGDSALTDTFTVRGDRRLQLPNLPDFSLAGVLDSELQPFLVAELSKYLKNPTVTANGLVRLTITGGVGQNGFHTFPVDQAITDVIMTSGGLSPNSKLDDTQVKRSGDVIINKKQFREAVRLGRTVGDLSLRDGDEIVVPVQTTTTARGGKYLAWTAGLIPVFWLIRIIRN